MINLLILVDESCIENIADEEIVTDRFVVLYVNCYVSDQVNLLFQLQSKFVFDRFELISHLSRVIGNLFSTQSIDFNIWLIKGEGTPQFYTLDCNNLRIQLRFLKQSLKIPDILYLARLCNPVSIRSEASLGIKFHNLVCVFECVEK